MNDELSVHSYCEYSYSILSFLVSVTSGFRDIAAGLEYVSSSQVGAISLSKRDGIQRAHEHCEEGIPTSYSRGLQ